MPLFGIGISRSKKTNIEAFVLQKKIGDTAGPESWENVQEFSPQDYTRAPAKDDSNVTELFDEGETYRMAIKFPGHEPVPDVRLGGWTKRVKTASNRASAKTDVGRAIEDSLKPAGEIFDALGNFLEKLNNLNARLYPQAEVGDGTGTGQEVIENKSKSDTIREVLNKANEDINMYKQLNLIKEFDPKNPYSSITPPTYNGALPIWMHPMVVNGLFGDMLKQFQEQAYDIGAKFHRGAIGLPKEQGLGQGQGQAAVPQPQIIPPMQRALPSPQTQTQQQYVSPAVLEINNPEEEEYEKHLREIVEEQQQKARAKKAKPKDAQAQEEEAQTVDLPVPPDAEKDKPQPIIVKQK